MIFKITVIHGQGEERRRQEGVAGVIHGNDRTSFVNHEVNEFQIGGAKPQTVFLNLAAETSLALFFARDGEDLS